MNYKLCMRKLLIFSFSQFVILTAAQAQTAEFRYQGQPLADGATVTIDAGQDAWGDFTVETNTAGSGADGLILVNLTSDDVNGTSHLSIPLNTLQPKTVQWCMGGLCVPIPGSSYDKEFTLPAGGYIQVQFDAVTIGNFGELLATITATVGSETLTVRVNFVHADPSVPRFVRRSVVEEYTGTWCGYCPRGMVGMRLLEQDFGDRFIPIAVHSNDVMEISGYRSLVPDGLPKCTIDRGDRIDPYGGAGSVYQYGLGTAFAWALSQPTEAGLELQAEWADAQQWDVRFTATTTFAADRADAPYRLAFILLEDGLHGEGRDWAQINYFSDNYSVSEGDKYNADLDEFKDADYYAEGLSYNHVPVNTLGVQSGITGSISAPIVALQPQHYSADVTTLSAKVIQDKEHLWAAALLLNTETGLVVNAARADIRPFGSSAAVHSVRTDASPSSSAVYDLQGRRVSPASMKKGIYVVNGKKVKK